MLLVDADDAARAAAASALRGAGYLVTETAGAAAALGALGAAGYDVAFCALQLAGVDGTDFLAIARDVQPDAAFVVMPERGASQSAADAIRLGAFDYVETPCDAGTLLAAADRACQHGVVQRRAAAADASDDGAAGGLVGRTPAMRRMLDLVARVAPMRTTVLITGETGTGKELVARRVHALSAHAAGAFVPVNCSALADTLLESELFGHAKGSFTGAVANRLGLIEAAHRGTLFLDEVSTVSAATQVKLLRVLQDRKVQRVGDRRTIDVDFRLVAATNVPLAREVAAGRFRQDLYFRLNVFPIAVPPLRQRRDDIPLLVRWFRERFARENGVVPPDVPPLTIARMMDYDWPGNVRELEHYVERALTMYAGQLSAPFLPPSGDEDRAERGLLTSAREERWTLERLGCEYILDVLDAMEGRLAETAEVLGIDRRTLYRKLREYEDARSPDRAGRCAC